MWTTVELAWNKQPVPVHSCISLQAIGDANAYFIPAMDSQRRAEISAILAQRVAGPVGIKEGLAGLSPKVDDLPSREHLASAGS